MNLFEGFIQLFSKCPSVFKPFSHPGSQKDDDNDQEGVEGEEGDHRGEQGEPESQVRRLWRGEERR